MLIVCFNAKSFIFLEITETDKPNKTKEDSTKVKIEENKLDKVISQNTKHVIKENKGN